jgi:flavorubredoxin
VDGLAYVESKGKQAAVFGSFGWSGEAAGQLQERLRGLRVKLPVEPLKIKLRPSDDELAQAKQFGEKFAGYVLTKETAEV